MAQLAIRKAVPAIVVVDDFLQNPNDIREFALAQEFVEHPKFHKGKRTEARWITPDLKAEFERLLGAKISKWEEHGVNGVFQICVAGDQVVYHCDHQEYAGMLYLTPDAPPQSGTATYMSRRTGWRKFPTEKQAASRGMTMPEAEEAMFAGKLLDSTAWEEVDVIGNVFNRLVLMNSKVVHSARNYFGSSLQDGRLFQLFFFDLEK